MADKRIDFLSVHKSTSGLSQEELTRIAEHVEIVDCQEDEVIHRVEAAVDALYLVVAGRLTLSVVSPTGEPTPLRQIGRDDQFGLLALSNQDPLPVQVVADQNTKLLRIEKSKAEELLIELPAWRHSLMKVVGPRLLSAFMRDKVLLSRRVVAFIHTSAESRPLTQAIVRRLNELNERIGVLTDEVGNFEGQTERADSLLDASGNMRQPEECRSILAQWREVDRIVFEATLDNVAPYLADLTNACEAVYWVCTDSSTTARAATAMEPLVNFGPARQEKQFVIRMLGDGHQAALPAPELKALGHRDFKVHWHNDTDSPVCSRHAGVERIVHHLRGVCVGLALGGGAARGMAHLGVLQVFEQAGIVIDRMSGTSAGALTGVIYAAGYSADFQINAFSQDLMPPWYYQLLPYGDAWYVLGKYRLGGWDPMLRKYLHNWQLEQLAIPFSSVAADLVSAEQFVREAGDASLAILESINLPGIARPICRHGMALVDGGVLNVVPADILLRHDANVVIASDVAARINFEFGGNSPDTPTDKMKVPRGVSTLIRMRTVQDRNLRSIGGGAANLVIEPDVSDVELTDFKNAAKIAELGRAAAEAALPEVKRLLNHTDAQLFPL